MIVSPAECVLRKLICAGHDNRPTHQLIKQMKSAGENRGNRKIDLHPHVIKFDTS